MHNTGPLMVFAGAGSGKTRVVTCRIARLIAEGTPAYRILAVTFTNKASREMRERIAHMVGPAAKDLWMGTFHSMSARLLRMEGKHIGIDPNFVVYDDGDQLGLIRDIMKRQMIEPKSVQPRAVLNEISRAKEKLLTPEQYSARATDYFNRICASIYKDYNAALRRANALDFDDLIMITVRLLSQVDEVRTKYQEKFTHVLVDEYQDINFSQYQLTQLLTGPHKNITVVGDDDQSIYAWRGADVSLMLRFSSDYPDATVVTLAQNYRSTQRILQGAHAVVKHNRGRADKQLWTQNGEGTPIVIRESGTENDEAIAIADAIRRDVTKGRRTFGAFAVLYRTNAQSRALEEAFVAMRIPHILVGGQRFYDRKEIKDAIAYLRLALNPADDVSFRRIINEPARGIGATSIGRLDELARLHGRSMLEVAGDPVLSQSLPAKVAKAVGGVAHFMDQARQESAKGQILPVITLLMERSGYIATLRQDNNEENISRLENLQELYNVIAEYDATTVEPSLSNFLENVALVSDVDALKESGEAVTLMTLHSSKGLEFPVVFIAGMEESIFPHSRSLNDDQQLEEERRLCYVGMTRAREELVLSFARRRSVFGQATHNSRSRFLSDIPADLVQDETEEFGGYTRTARWDEAPIRRVQSERTGTTRVIEAAPPPTAWTPPFTVGAKVTHKKFGIGIVIACAPVKNDAEVTVAFPGAVGVKKLIQSFAKLEAVSE